MTAEGKSVDELVDINSVSVDTDLPKEERIKQFIRQIKNPYMFKCGKFVVKASFNDNGQSLEDCIKGIIKQCLTFKRVGGIITVEKELNIANDTP